MVSANYLRPRAVERVWGLDRLPPWVPHVKIDGGPVGEIWFEEPDGVDHELLVKLLFTAERLSIQVHPDDAAAQAIGQKRGKDEAWLVLDADAGAVIGLGLKHAVSRDELRAAAISGEIEQLVSWKPVERGEVYYSPAGTVHAIGAGLTIVEIQQNLDLTFRLYDYGRPRELHLNEGVAAAHTWPYQSATAAREVAPGREILHTGGAFVLERWYGDAARSIAAKDASLLVIPAEDGGRLDGQSLTLGSVLRVEGDARLEGERHVIAAYPGAEIRPTLIT